MSARALLDPVDLDHLACGQKQEEEVLGTPRGLALRPYQREALAAIATSPHKRQVLAIACGLGKTVIFSHLVAQTAARGERCLVLVHTDELCSQTVDKLALVAPGLPVGVVRAARDERNAPIIVASVQTLARRSRRERLTPDFTLVVVDECHHAPSPSYRTAVVGRPPQTVPRQPSAALSPRRALWPGRGTGTSRPLCRSRKGPP